MALVVYMGLHAVTVMPAHMAVITITIITMVMVMITVTIISAAGGTSMSLCMRVVVMEEGISRVSEQMNS